MGEAVTGEGECVKACDPQGRNLHGLYALVPMAGKFARQFGKVARGLLPVLPCSRVRK